MMPKQVATVFALAVFPALLVSQAPPEFTVDVSGYRSLAESVRRLREKTGWLLSVEEPVWPARSTPLFAKPKYFGPHGWPEEPPDQDRIRVSIRTLRGPSARQAAIAVLLDTYNQQNPGITMRANVLGNVTVIVPESLSDSKGGRAVARTILSARISVPVAKRSPDEHMMALADAIAAQVNMPIEIDTAAFGFGFNWAYAGQDGGAAEWGTTLTTARLALLDYLKQSKTDTVWQVDCQLGVGSPGHCAIGLIPLTIEVKDRTGRLVQKRLSYEHGGALFEPPPPPPGP